MPLPALPIVNSLPALRDALASRPNAILIAPPGAGKTTLVPLALLDAPWRRDGGRIVMLEPRRLATRAAATRMAALRGEPVGQSVGFRTRLEAAVSRDTVIEVVTEGLLVRRLQSDPGLEGVDAVIFDEIHERGLDADLALAFCLDLQRHLRPELRLIAMSATADGARLATLLDAAVVESEGRMHPVEVRHAARDLARIRDLPDAMARAIRASLAESQGDVLAFLPGMGDIRRTEQALRGCGALVLTLHGDLPPAEQDLALRPSAERRVVLATSIAETSLTVPGVRIVIDGGWRKSPRLDAGTGLSRLETMRISRAAADQRAGRAGREAPGIAVRLWTQAQHRGLAAFDPPEILHAELSGLALDCAAWGASPADLSFADAPPSGPLAAAQSLLRALGAMDDAGLITGLGRRMARLGAHPRLAAMMLSAATPGEAALAADLAALLEERDPLRNTADADIAHRLAAVAHGAADADRGALARIRQGAAQFRKRLETRAEPSGDPARLLAAAFPDRIAQRRGEPGSFRLSGGGGARLGSGDKLASANLLVVAKLEQKLSAQICLAARLDAQALPPNIEAQVSESLESGFDEASGAVYSRRRRRYGALVLEDRMVPADQEAVAATLAAVVARRIETLPWTDEARQLQARAALARSLDDAFPDLSDAALAQGVQTWLAPRLIGMSRLADVARLDLLRVLRDHLGWDACARLDRDFPIQLALPSGRAVVDYADTIPRISARAQAFYGLRETPRLAGGRVPVRLALLSPAGRPVAITADLAGFWTGAWADVRRDMRGRYPRHDWPENPGGGT
jgi:ATP-dependent helicase HrpB